MTNLTPPDPERQREKNDERIAAFVAFAALGAVLFWGITRGGDKFNIAKLNPVPDVIPGLTSDQSAIDSDGGGTGDSDQLGLLGLDQDPNQSTGSKIFDPFQPDEPTDDEPSDEIQTSEQPEQPSPPVAESEADKPSQPPIAFSDVASTFWAKPFIDGLSEQGFLGGFNDGTFQPNKDVNRAEFAAAIEQSFGDGNSQNVVTYSDVSADYWASSAIQAATQSGFMSGYPEGVFLPENNVTRLESLISMATGLNLDIPNNPEVILEQFSDRDQIPEWALGKIAAAAEAELIILEPDSQRLEPDSAITRAETSALIYQALFSQGRVPEITSDYIVQVD